MKRLLVLANLAVLAVGAQAVNLVQNGGFEQVQIASNTWQAVNGTTNTGLLPFWTYFGGANNNVALTGANYLQQTSQQVDVSGGSDIVPSGIYQSIATVANQNYVLSFQVYTGGGLGHSGGVNMHAYAGALNGPVLATGSNLQGWNFTGNAGLRTYTYSFTATSNVTTIAFSMFSRPVSHVDNVSLQAVPEPFTMGLGLAAAGVFVRRRLKKS